MIVGFDIRYLSHAITGGVKTYVAQLARWLPRVAPDVSLVYYADTKAPLELDDIGPNVAVRTLRYRSPLSTFVLDRTLAGHMGRDRVDVAHFPANYGPTGRYRLAVTVHDSYNLFPMREHRRAFGRDPWRVAMMLYLGHHTRRALATADAIVTVSEHARADLAHRSGRPAATIAAVHSAADAAFCETRDEAALARLLTGADAARGFVLADGIKNASALVEAWGALPAETRAGRALVFFSREAAPRADIAAAVDGRSVLFLPRPDTASLIRLMSHALAFAFPSFHEGFGLPLVEAMACGAPIVASTRGSIPEVVGDAALLFEVDDRREFSTHLARLVESPDLRARMREASLARARDFSWEQTARQTAAVYRALAAGQPVTP